MSVTLTLPPLANSTVEGVVFAVRGDRVLAGVHRVVRNWLSCDGCLSHEPVHSAWLWADERWTQLGEDVHFPDGATTATPAPAIADDGTLYMAWSHGTEVQVRAWTGAEWSNVAPAFVAPSEGLSSTTRLFTHQERLILAGGREEVWTASIRPGDGQWSAVSVVEPPVLAMGGPIFDFSANGVLSAVLGTFPEEISEPGGVYVYRLEAKRGAWRLLTRLGDATCTTNWYPVLSSDGAGRLIAAFQTCGGERNLITAYREGIDGTWVQVGQPQDGVPGATTAWASGAAIDRSGRPVVAWREQAAPARDEKVGFLRRYEGAWMDAPSIPSGHLQRDHDGSLLVIDELTVHRVP